MDDKKKTTERFFKVPNELMATKLIDPYALKIYAVINSFTQNSPDKCFKGSNKYLSIVAGINEKTVKKKIKLLLDKPWILTNGYQNELRRLQAIPVELIDELQKEYKSTLKTLEELTKSFEEGKTPLEEWLEKKLEQESKEKNRSPKEDAEVLIEENGKENEDRDVPLDGDDVPEETPEIPHSETSDKTSSETSGETVDDTSAETSVDKSEKTLDDAINDLFEIDDDTPSNITPPTKDNAEHIPTVDELEYADDTSNEMKELQRIQNEIGMSNPYEVAKQFQKATGRKLVSMGFQGIEEKLKISIYGETTTTTEQRQFDRSKFMVIDSNWKNEIISQYE
nr:hypothetical protein [uncultured Brumimicrobium sp.]